MKYSIEIKPIMFKGLNAEYETGYSKLTVEIEGKTEMIDEINTKLHQSNRQKESYEKDVLD